MGQLSHYEKSKTNLKKRRKEKTLKVYTQALEGRLYESEFMQIS